jgi:gamma-D-glutamyl-L-lysine dipeptidyl-peptidase
VRSVGTRLVVALSLLALVACSGGGGGGGGDAGPPPTPGPTTSVAEPVAVQVGGDAWVDVTVANLWAEPDQARPLDAPSLGEVVDIDAWLAAMTVDDRRWLVDRLVTQALYGDRVTVVETAGAWTKVVVLRQPSSLDPRGYPGWLPTVQVTSVPPPRPAGPSAGDAVVIRRAAPLGDGPPMELSFNTRLPVVHVVQAGVEVGIPGGGTAALATGDFVILPPDSRPPTADEVIASAEMFTGLDYLWAGASGSGFDCSGLTSAVYAAHGVVIPRDADDQAAVGTPVERADLRPGDLLFFATGTDRTSIHHVGMYVGDGRMIQSPATGRAVETVSIDQPGLASQYWGARRYVP